MMANCTDCKFLIKGRSLHCGHPRTDGLRTKPAVSPHSWCEAHQAKNTSDSPGRRITDNPRSHEDIHD